MSNLSFTWRKALELRVHDKFEYYQEDRLLEAIVLELLEGTQNTIRLKVLTEGGSAEVELFKKASVRVNCTPPEVSYRLASRPQPTRFGNVSID